MLVIHMQVGPISISIRGLWLGALDCSHTHNLGQSPTPILRSLACVHRNVSLSATLLIGDYKLAFVIGHSQKTERFRAAAVAQVLHGC